MEHFSPKDDKGPTLLVLTCILTSIATVTTLLRLWVRRCKHNLGWDDGAIALTTLLSIARMAVQIVSVKYGNGRHRQFLSKHQYEVVNMLTWYTQVLLFPTICLLKVSICILLLRIKDTRILRYFLGAVIIGLIVTHLECLVVLLAECSPVKSYWDGTSNINCWRPHVRIYSIYFQASYSILTDLVCTTLPVIVVWNVKIPFTTKCAVCGLMSMGLIATICSAIRASSLGTKTTDLSYAYCIAAIWANTELLLGIIAANLALARSIFKFFTEHARTLTSNISQSRTTNIRNSFATPSRLGYLKSPDHTECATEEGQSPRRSESSGIPLRPYVQNLDSAEKA